MRRHKQRWALGFRVVGLGFWAPQSEPQAPSPQPGLPGVSSVCLKGLHTEDLGIFTFSNGLGYSR